MWIRILNEKALISAKENFEKYLTDQTGATAIEYGLIAALISLSIIAGATAIGNSTTGVWGEVNDKFSAVEADSS